MKPILRCLSLLMPLIIFQCANIDIWSKIREGNYEIVKLGTYRGKLKYLPNPKEYEKTIMKFKKEIEENIDLLPRMVNNFFSVTEELKFQYKFTWLDEEKRYLILRYFAPVFRHPVYAGYQIQFVVCQFNNRIIQIYVSEVPLE
uniref:Uncharacterized protein n=1 Tax=candidate division WOR-3 bacterium TaxID=2052148 RepID=A0A7C4XA34_UNCW3